MTGIRGLPRTLLPFEDESLSSLIMRSARLYHFRDPMRVLKRLKVPHAWVETLASIKPDTGLTTGIASVLGVSPATLDRLSPWGLSDRMASIRCVEIGRNYLPHRSRRSCSACLAESLYHRDWWQVGVITACPRHAQPLLRNCPGCGKPIYWRGSELERCGSRECRYDLRSDVYGGRPVQLACSTGLLDLLSEGSGATLEGSGLPFGRTVEAAHAIGTFVLGRPRLGYASSFVAGDPDRIAGTMEIGWAALQDWPQGFHSALDQMRVGAENRGKHYGLEREFGGFSEWLSKTSPEEWARPLRDAFGQYLSAQPSLRTTRRGLVRYGNPEVLRGGYMTRNEAADLLEVSSQTMMDLAERENLYAVTPAGAGIPSLLDAGRVEQLRVRKEATLLKEAALALLGVGVKAFDGILGLGVLEILPEGERITLQRMFVKSSIEGLIARVRSRLTPARAGAKLISFSRCGGGRGTTDLLRAVLDGRLRPSGLARKAVGLSAFLFDQRDVAAAFPAERTTLNLIEVAAKLGENVLSIRAWARAGYLPTEKRPGSLEAGSRVTLEGIAHFRREYATATEISERAATTPRWATHRLAFHGIQSLPIKARTAIYPRDVITEDLLPKLSDRKGASSPSERAAKSADLACRVGERVAEDFGLPLQRRRSSFSNSETGTFVQVMVGSSPRIGASYAFRFNLAMRQGLDGAREAWVALALAEGNSFILLPWSEARQIIGAGDKPRTLFFLAVDGQGRVGDERMRSRQKRLSSFSSDTEDQPVSP